MTKRMLLILNTIKGYTCAGQRGWMPNYVIDLDRGPFARSGRALLRRDLITRLQLRDGDVIWGLTDKGWAC